MYVKPQRKYLFSIISVTNIAVSYLFHKKKYYHWDQSIVLSVISFHKSAFKLHNVLWLRFTKWNN